MNIRKDDTVVVISGKYNYKNDESFIKDGKLKGHKVLVAMPKEGKLIVEGVNVASKHQRPRKQGEEGGIIKQETPIYACKVMLLCPKCGKATKVGHKFVQDGDNMKKVRVCKKCGAEI